MRAGKTPGEYQGIKSDRAGKVSHWLSAAGVSGSVQPVRASCHPLSSSVIAASTANLSRWSPLTERYCLSDPRPPK